MPDAALQPVASAVFRCLNVPALTAPAPVGLGARVTDNPVTDEDQTFPFVWYELATEENQSGLGRGPWLHMIDLRIHTFSTSPGMKEAQRINQTVIGLVRDAQWVIAEWSHWATPFDRIVLLPFEELNGVKVRELVAMFRLYVEERATVAPS